jgi:hypothetical protein
VFGVEVRIALKAIEGSLNFWRYFIHLQRDRIKILRVCVFYQGREAPPSVIKGVGQHKYVSKY